MSKKEISEQVVAEQKIDEAVGAELATEEGKKVSKSNFKFDLPGFLKTKKGKVVAIVAGVAVLLGLVFGIPYTRYAVLGTVVKKSVVVTVLDSTTGKPVTEATVEVAGKTSTTDVSGKATIDSVSVGSHVAKVTKSYYNEGSQNVLVPVFSDSMSIISVQATGRQVPVVVINKISGKSVANALVVAGESSTKTDSKGEAILVLPADQEIIKAIVKTEGYNDLEAEVTVTEQADDKNKFSIVPSGKVFYAVGPEIYSTDMDGSSKKLLVKSSGYDNIETFGFKVSPDRSRIVLKSWRTAAGVKLYLVDIATGDLSVIDDKDNVSYELFGWSGDRVLYSVKRLDMNEWEPKREVLKTYQPSSNTYVTIDENTAAGEFNNVAIERFREAYFLGGEIVYLKDWILPHGGTGDIVASKRISVMSARADGQAKKLLVDMNNHYFMQDVSISQYSPLGIYIKLVDGNRFMSYQNGSLEEDSAIESRFYDSYGVYSSPDGTRSIWRAQDASYIGDGEGNNATTTPALADYRGEGWPANGYVLLSDETYYHDLYIASVDGDDISTPVKVATFERTGY